MSEPKIFFHTNIRLLRERKRLSQEDFAQLIGLKRNTLQALESGRTKNPTVIDFLKFSEKFKMSIDTLMKVDLSRLGESKLRELEAGNDVYISGGQLRVLAITVNKDNKENIEYVPVKAKAGYASGYNDPDFIAALPKFNMPNVPKGTFRMFPISGDSMTPVPDGSDVIGRYVEDWKSVKPRSPCIVILKGENDFVFKLITVNKDKTVLLESLNTNYKAYTVDTGDILEVWQFHSYHTKEMPEPATDIQEIKMMLKDLGNKIEMRK